MEETSATDTIVEGYSKEKTVYFEPTVENEQFVVVSTLQDENFVNAALFSAVEEGNLVGLEELLSLPNIDINQCNKHGETVVHIATSMCNLDALKLLHSKGADLCSVDDHGDSTMHWAARQDQDSIVEYLHEQGVSVNTKNKAGETPLHIAGRYGHVAVVDLLCSYGANINSTDEHGESPLHVAVWHGFPKVAQVLCEKDANTSLRNKEDETPLHSAAARGHNECVKCLLDSGSEPDLIDKNGSTPLHLALRRHHLTVALLLLHSGCQIDVIDNMKESAIHIVAREGLLQLAQTLCAFGCKVDVPNKSGMYPLHLAAKNGHTEVVRCLCLAGCCVDKKNKDGIVAEITALAQGFGEIGDMLNRLRTEQIREEYISQLIPSSQPISCIKLKVFGQSGVGKSIFLESLKCGYFSSLFRRSRTSSSLSPIGRSRRGDHSSKSSIELNSSGPDEPPLSFETNIENYTHGIDIQQANISGVGDFSLWEFSGHEPYYMMYDNFIGNCNCIHAIIFKVSDPYEVQVQQVLFWLEFLKARIPPQEPLEFCGKSSQPAKVVLIGTHADIANCHRHSTSGEYVSSEASSVLHVAQQKFQHIFDLHDSVFVMDVHVVGSPAMKALKQYLSANKNSLIQNLPNRTSFLDAVIAHLPMWRKSAATFPVITWQQFVDMVHLQVNLLAGEEHMKELIQQMQLMGEVIYLKSETQDMVVLTPRWLCVDAVGHLLSQEHLEQARVTGVYSVEDVQLLFPESDALDLLQVLEALHICIQCDNDGDVEYEFPCFNMVETLEGLWEKGDSIYINGVYGGIKIKCQSGIKHMLACLFSRLQIYLRRSAQEHSDPENDLYQWFQGSKFCSGSLEGMITLADQKEVFEIKVRGPPNMKSDCFYFLEDLVSVVDQMLLDVCPGLILEKHYMSASQLKNHVPQVATYSPQVVLEALLNEGILATVNNSHTCEQESILDLVFFGCPELINQPITPNGHLVLASDLHASHLSLLARQCLCAKLDPQEPMGRDWCMLGVLLGMTDKLSNIDPGENPAFSPTGRILNEWMKYPDSTLGCLITKLKELSRTDAMEVVLQAAPLVKVFPTEDDEDEEEEEGGGGEEEEETPHEEVVVVGSDSHTSTSNLSR